MTIPHTSTRPSDSTPEHLAEIYFDAWQRGDVDLLAPHLHEQVTFDGPLAQLAGRQDCLDGLRGLFAATTGIRVLRRMTGSTDVMTWFELKVGDAEPTPVVNWSETDGERITHIRATFDPRGML